jgi:hypothetical protein
MSDDDFAFLKEHLPNYSGYGDEVDRHDTDMRVRAFVGEKLTEAIARFTEQISPDDAAAGERTLMQCMFTDQAFIRRIEHASLDANAQAQLATADRRLVEVAAGADTVTAADFRALLTAVDRQFALRYEPLPATT